MDHKTDTDRGRDALIAYLKDCDDHAIVPDVGGAFHAAFMAGRASLAANAGSEPAAAYSIDADPHGIRATVADAITGALAFGAQGVNQPPEGHWLAPFWKAAREDKAAVRVKRDLRSELQQQCSTWGTYWRGSDAHGVVLSHPQAVELLQNALGVEVEIEVQGCQVCDYTGVIGDVPCPGCTHPSPPEGIVGGWIALPGALPEPGTPVLLDIGKKYPIRAMWAAKFTVEASPECSDDWAEYDEAADTYYCPEGWYEWNEHEETHWRVTATPRAWAPLPPTTSADSKGE